MASALRYVGWALFLLGMALFVYVGAFSAVRDADAGKRILGYVGLFGALLGMILTSLSRLLAHFRHMRKLKDSVRRRGDRS